MQACSLGSCSIQPSEGTPSSQPARNILTTTKSQASASVTDEPTMHPPAGILPSMRLKASTTSPLPSVAKSAARAFSFSFWSLIAKVLVTLARTSSSASMYSSTWYARYLSSG